MQIFEEGASDHEALQGFAGGHFETQVDFLVAFNAWLTTPGASDIADAGFASSFRAIEDGDRWTLEVTIGTAVTSIQVNLSETVVAGDLVVVEHDGVRDCFHQIGTA